MRLKKFQALVRFPKLLPERGTGEGRHHSLVSVGTLWSRFESNANRSGEYFPACPEPRRSNVPDGASAIDCWWDQHNPIVFNMLLAEMVLAVLWCRKYKISHFAC